MRINMKTLIRLLGIAAAGVVCVIIAQRIIRRLYRGIEPGAEE